MLGNGLSASLVINKNASISTKWDSSNIQTLSNNSYVLRVSGSDALRFVSGATSSGIGNKVTALISTNNSYVNSGVFSSVIIGGQGLTASQSNTVYLGNIVNINNKYNLPSVDGTVSQVLRTNGNGNLYWSSIGVVTGTGSTNFLTRWTPNGSTLGNSLIRDNGSNLSINTALDSLYLLKMSTNTHNTTQFITNVTSNSFGFVKVGLDVSSLGINSGAGNIGISAVSNGSLVENIGINSTVRDILSPLNYGGKFEAISGTLNIGGKFVASSGDSDYSLELQDGTEEEGKFLKSVTGDGKANWAYIDLASDVRTGVAIAGQIPTTDGLGVFSWANISGLTASNGVSIYKGYNISNSTHEFKGVTNSVSIDVSSSSTDLSLNVKEISENIGTGVNVYKEFDDTTKKHKFKGVTNSVSIDVSSSSTDLSLNIKEISENIGTGVNVYKEFDDITKKHKFKGVTNSVSIDVISSSTDLSLNIKENLQSLTQSGFSIYKEFDDTTKKHKVRSISSSTLNIDYNLDESMITIDTIVSTSNLSFYVDQYSVATEEDGSEARPFKTLNKALDVFIGAGDWEYPQYAGYKITLLSYVTLHESAGLGYTGRVNLDINSLYIIGNGHYLNLSANPSPDYYPISTRRMVGSASRTLGLTLETSIGQVYENLYLQRMGTNAIVDHLNFAYPGVTHSSPLSPSQNSSQLTFKDVIFTNDTDYLALNPSNWQTVPDPNDSGNPVTFFGQTVYVSPTQSVGVPMIKSEDMSWNKEGNLSFQGVTDLVNGTGVYLAIKNTTFNSGILRFGRNQTRTLYDSIVSGIYTPKTNQYYITCDNVGWCAMDTLGPMTIPSVVDTLGGTSYYIGGSDAWIKMINSNLYLNSSKIEGGYNNIIQADGNSYVSLSNSIQSNTYLHDSHGHYKVISPTPSIATTFRVSDSTIYGVILDSSGVDTSYIQEVFGVNNVINGYTHNNNGTPTYADNAAALLAGLFKGMEYVETGTGVLKSVY
jgi:hypothetical protein